MEKTNNNNLRQEADEALKAEVMQAETLAEVPQQDAGWQRRRANVRACEASELSRSRSGSAACSLPEPERVLPHTSALSAYALV